MSIYQDHRIKTLEDNVSFISQSLGLTGDNTILSTKIDNEIQSRINGDTNLQNNIISLSGYVVNNDNNLQSQLVAISSHPLNNIALNSFATSTTLGGARNALGPYSDAIVVTNNSSVNRTLKERFSDYINVRDFGAVGDGITDCTSAFISAAAQLPANGGCITVPGSGNYMVDSSSSLGTNSDKKIRWLRPNNARINNSFPVAPAAGGIWDSSFDIYDNDFGVGMASLPTQLYSKWRRTDFPVPPDVALSEVMKIQNHALDKSGPGTITQVIALEATTTTDSQGYCFATNFNAIASPAALQGAQIIGLEIDIYNKSISGVNIKTGMQVVDGDLTSGGGELINSTGYGIAKRGIGVGWNNGMLFGTDGYALGGNYDLVFPLTSVGTGIRFAGTSASTMSYGIHFGSVTTNGNTIQFATNHTIGWGAASGYTTNGSKRGSISSNCTADTGGKIVFSNNGISLYGVDNDTTTASTALQVIYNGGTGNPVWLQLGGVLKNVIEGANDSGGSGYRLLRVQNS